jgi:regulator of replication initiation timing
MENKKQLFKDLRTLTNDIIELNKRLFELCVRMNDLIEEEESTES